MNPIEKRTISTLALIYALRMFGLFMVLPVIALYGSDYEGASPALLGIAIGAYGLTQALLQLPFGVWSDRIGRKPVILIGLILFTLGSAVSAMADSIWMLIMGRAMQGAGAVASTLMALMTDLTREENRTKAMATIGASIGLSFTLAMVLGPILAAWFGLSGLFTLTAILSVLAMVLLFTVVPTPKQQVRSRDARAFVHQLADVFADRQILRLSYGIFALHSILVACFVAVPVLLKNAGLIQSDHWQVYMPVMLVAFICMVPFIIVAEKKFKMKEVLALAVAILIISVCSLYVSAGSLFGLISSLWLFFLAFNILEASLPSLEGVFLGMLPFLLVWLGLVLTMARPKHLTSYMVNLSNTSVRHANDLEERLLALPGVDEVVIMLQEKAAYLKVDNKQFDPIKLKQLNV